MARVTGPDGRSWRIGRQWLPWQVRRREIDSDDTFHLAEAADDPLSVLALFALAVVAAVLLAFLLPLLLLGLEIALLTVLVPLLAAFRVLTRRSFTVTARERGKSVPAATQRVVGWRASGRVAVGWAEQVRSGGQPSRLPWSPCRFGLGGTSSGLAACLAAHLPAVPSTPAVLAPAVRLRLRLLSTQQQLPKPPRAPVPTAEPRCDVERGCG